MSWSFLIAALAFSSLQWDLALSKNVTLKVKKVCNSLYLLGQSFPDLLQLENNPVVEGQNLVGNCTNPNSTSSITVVVGGVPDGRGVQRQQATGSLVTFTIPNITRGDNNVNLSCFYQSGGMEIDFGFAVIVVVCKL